MVPSLQETSFCLWAHSLIAGTYSTCVQAFAFAWSQNILLNIYAMILYTYRDFCKQESGGERKEWNMKISFKVLVTSLKAFFENIVFTFSGFMFIDFWVGVFVLQCHQPVPKNHSAFSQSCFLWCLPWEEAQRIVHNAIYESSLMCWQTCTL